VLLPTIANPVAAIARSMTNTSSGIRPGDVPWFILAEIVGALLAMALFRWLLKASAPVTAGPSLARRRAP
jgi:glycerol uptake facilitator-like aquaporin